MAFDPYAEMVAMMRQDVQEQFDYQQALANQQQDTRFTTESANQSASGAAASAGASAQGGQMRAAAALEAARAGAAAALQSAQMQAGTDLETARAKAMADQLATQMQADQQIGTAQRQSGILGAQGQRAYELATGGAGSAYAQQLRDLGFQTGEAMKTIFTPSVQRGVANSGIALDPLRKLNTMTGNQSADYANAYANALGAARNSLQGTNESAADQYNTALERAQAAIGASRLGNEASVRAIEAAGKTNIEQARLAGETNVNQAQITGSASAAAGGLEAGAAAGAAGAAAALRAQQAQQGLDLWDTQARDRLKFNTAQRGYQFDADTASAYGNAIGQMYAY